MDRGDTTQGLGNPGENVDSYFHPLPSSLFSVQTRQALEIEGKFASSTKKRQSHLANPGYMCNLREVNRGYADALPSAPATRCGNGLPGNNRRCRPFLGAARHR